MFLIEANTKQKHKKDRKRRRFKKTKHNKPAKPKTDTYTCTVCALKVSSADVLQSHINGQKHAKTLRQIDVSLEQQKNVKLQEMSIFNNVKELYIY